MTKEIISEYERYELDDLKSALLIGSYTKKAEKEICIEHLDELSELASTYGFTTAEKMPCHIRKFDAATFYSKGKVEEMHQLAEDLEADVILLDDEVSPNQQKNLEAIFNKPVLDRSELILEVFAKHAKTNESKLQIELAQVKYQMPRLKRLWTHLSRKRAGGKGFLGGEGETQIEIDRRLKGRQIPIS